MANLPFCKTILGHYSLIQYVPIFARQEGINVGVILLVPQIGFIDVRMSPDNDRAKKFFVEVNESFLESAKNSMRERINTESSQLSDLNNFLKFVETRVNEIRLTKPSPIKIYLSEEYSSKDELNRLYKYLVE